MKIRQLSRIQSDDPILNRIQDHHMEVVNPVLRDLGTTPLVTGAKGGNAALTSLIAALVQIGLITDGTS